MGPPPSPPTSAAEDAADAYARLAAAVHDAPLQLLLSAVQELDCVADDPPALGRAQQSLLSAVVELRQLFVGHAPSAAPVEPIERPFLPFLVEVARRGGFLLHVQISPTMVDPPPLIKHLAREFIINAAKHAGAENLWVCLDATPAEISLVVRDDGRGLPEGIDVDDDHHLGLRLARTRVLAAGGTLRLAAAEGGGLEVTATLPRT